METTETKQVCNHPIRLSSIPAEGEALFEAACSPDPNAFGNAMETAHSRLAEIRRERAASSDGECVGQCIIARAVARRIVTLMEMMKERVGDLAADVRKYKEGLLSPEYLLQNVEQGKDVTYELMALVHYVRSGANPDPLAVH